MASAFVHLREALIAGWMGEWRSGSAAALHAVGRGFESLFAHHFSHRKTHLFPPVPQNAKVIWRFPPNNLGAALLKNYPFIPSSRTILACRFGSHIDDTGKYIYIDLVLSNSNVGFEHEKTLSSYISNNGYWLRNEYASSELCP